MYVAVGILVWAKLRDTVPTYVGSKTGGVFVSFPLAGC